MRVFLLSVSLSAVLSFASEIVLQETGVIIAFFVLLTFIGLGIVFDIIGVAVTAADTKPFYSMASHRTKGAKEAIWLIKNANKVSSLCNDVVGDICGIVSGTTGAVIVLEIQQKFGLRALFVSIIVTALISGLTIGGKAIGKEFAMKKSKNVVYTAAKVMLFFRIGKKK
ncbi:MAG: hypothetical protein IIV78_02270 [Oscillospiraceae bacterium]|nr:hypothetical protein [Oscillospiraceae bacterium]